MNYRKMLATERDRLKKNIEEAKRQAQLIMGDREFATLEELLYKDSQTLASLQILRRELDFGKANRTLVNELFPVIKKEVDKFFCVQNIDEPNIQYRPIYGVSIVSYAIGGVIALGVAYEMVFNRVSDPALWIFMGLAGLFVFIGALPNYVIDSKYNNGTIRVMEKTKVNVVSVLSHEYGHHIQRTRLAQEKDDSKKYYLTFEEGVDRAAQRHVCKSYAEREDNEAYNFNILNHTVSELKSMYSWVCKIDGRPIKDSLLKVRTTQDNTDRYFVKKYGYPTRHAIGNAIYYVFDTLGRDKECQAMRNGTFDF